MKKCIITQVFLIAVTSCAFAQQPGDTIKISAFKYGSATRDTSINFPSGSQTFEKIVLKYNMRCKNGLISNQSQPNQGCGEWDYSCGTYVVDSTKIENAAFTKPSYVISNHTGSVFPYTSQVLYDYYNFMQNTVVLNGINSETQYSVGIGNTPAPNVLKSNEKSGRAQLLYTAAELTAAGLSAGNIDGFLLNVSNAGGGVNFFKVNMRLTSLTNLNAGTVTLTGFTNVYNSNYTFTNGSNRVQFYTPFAWDGISNILLDLSFTNTNPGNPVVFSGTAGTSILALYAKNNYALDLSANGHVNLNAAGLSSINNEITVTFWAYGKSALMPTETVLLYGYGNNPSQRNFNLHLPWSDNNMYFDCGYGNGSFDRINKVATAAEQGGQWNHWAFTKNAATGNMSIYLNGLLWHSGSSKVQSIAILNLILGKDNDFKFNWKGKINELTVWNKELSQANIQAWMNKPIEASHPFYNNLLAYFKLDEGNGLMVNESKNGLVSNGTDLQWSYERGSELKRTFGETNIRPDVTFVRGNYNLTTSTVTVTDSVQRNPNIVYHYTVISNATVTPPIDDSVGIVSVQYLYGATPVKIYNGDTGALTGTVAVTPQNTITVSTLTYIRRFPFYNEIMTFVTPYGLGLDLGPKGKTWYYDLSDLAPILKGPKRIVMKLGGEYQEQMDIDFLFIVGTPPRNVLEFNQPWQGAARDGGSPIARINNDTRYTVLSMPTINGAQAFKVRSRITGHGSDGEFKQNGGTVDHFLNVNGGPAEYTWQITQECATNVIFPQGGTWVYDREGWCPGQSSLLKEFDMTPFITPGSTITLDYGCSNPPKPSGDYHYVVANQLITYGAPNHSLDARIVDVIAPSNKVAWSRINPVCSGPVVVVQNSGSTPVTDLTIEYRVNSGPVQTYSWTGNLAFLDTAAVRLPVGTLWQNGTQTNGNMFYAQINQVNSAVDQYSLNNTYTSPFYAPISITNSFTIEFKTNNNYTENSYTLTDDQGNQVGSASFTAANTIYSDYYELNGCYTLKVLDQGNDGLSWWANQGQGNGYVRLKNELGNIVRSFQPDFGKEFEFSFTTYNPTAISAANEFESRINLFPNPSHGKFMLEGSVLEGADVVVSDLLGHKLNVPVNKSGRTIEFNTLGLSRGMYMVTITKGSSSAVKKVVVN